MINDQKFLGIIPARGGSKRLPGKNIKRLAGKPLIAWTIAAAQQSQYLDHYIVTSDDDDILNIAKTINCPVLKRAKALALDTTSSYEVVRDVLEQLPNYHYIVLLQPTSPLRTATDIDNCIVQCMANNQLSCVSITHHRKPNGAIYVAQVPWLTAQQTFVSDDTLAYIMPESRSVDIDTQHDFDRAQQLLIDLSLEDIHA